MPAAFTYDAPYVPPTRTAVELREANAHFYPDPERGDYSREVAGRYAARDFEIMRARAASFDRRGDGPRVGDYCIRTDGTLERFSHDHGEPWGLQTAKGGSFYLGDGYASFSGALEPCVPRERLADTGASLPAWFWFFSQDQSGGGRGVYCRVPVRVYRESEAQEAR